MIYIVFIFITSREYQGREEIIRKKTYIDAQWREPFNFDKLAEAVYISKFCYARLFKQHTGMTHPIMFAGTSDNFRFVNLVHN